MFFLDGAWVFSASELVSQLECDHRVGVTHAVKAGVLAVEAVEPDGMLVLAGAHGDAHERRVLEQLRVTHPVVVEIPDPVATHRGSVTAAAAATVAAMRDGADVVYQAVFFDGEFYGKADFVMRVGGDAESGWRYEVWDTKLSRSAKPGALLQLVAYSEQVAKAGFAMPQRMHVWLGDDSISSHDVDDVLPVLVHVRDRLRARLAAPAVAPVPVWGQARAACGHCGFAEFCAAGREADRDLSLVAGVRADQRRALHDAGVPTIDALADLTDAVVVDGVSAPVLARLRAQARLQVAQDATRTADDPVGVVAFEVFADDGLRLLPPPSPGDVWFDMEGDPFAQGGRGLEYLFGAVTADSGVPVFTPWWGHDLAGERAAFEAFVDFVQSRRAVWPDLHVYHYAPYERTALRRLMGAHGTREAVIDDWLRSEVLVDLYAVVRGSIRVSQRSYSIKALEPLYGRIRTEDVKTAGDSVVDYEAYLDLLAAGDPAAARAKLDGIAAYNEVDCLSTWELDRWLRDRATNHHPYHDPAPDTVGPADGASARRDDTDRTAAPGTGGGGGRVASRGPASSAGDAGASAVVTGAGGEEEVPPVVTRLLAGVPADPAGRSDQQQAQAMLAAAVDYHRREDKPAWWEHFQRLDQPMEDLESDVGVVIIRGVTAGAWDRKRTLMHRELVLDVDPDSEARLDRSAEVFLVYDAPPEGMATARDGGRGYLKATIDRREPGRLVVTESWRMEWPPSQALPDFLTPGPPIATRGQRARIRDTATAVADGLPVWPDSPVADILARRPPRLIGGMPLPRTGNDIADVTAAVNALDGSYLAVQGPPGTGKTYLGARVIAHLVNAGWRVGVVAQGHAVVENLLDKAIAAGLDPAKVAKEPKRPPGGLWARTTAQINTLLAGDHRGVLIGGTAWTFTRTDARPAGLDLLVIDEAGQFSLADTIAVAAAAKNLLLLGDPAQLPQVSTGTHPEPVDQAALSWIAGGEQVLPTEYGYFLATTWRMHSAVCAPVSRLAYRRRLHADPRTDRRHLGGIEPGVHPVQVAHADRSTDSPEEVTEVLRLVRDTIDRPWTDEHGTRTLMQEDVLVVAPYNRQVNTITAALQAAGLGDVRVGTVDRFQGQEAPVVIVSMTASSADDLPRGMDFLLSRNRLNVAVSRAEWATHIVHSPDLTDLSPTTARQLVLLGGLLGLLEESGAVTSGAT